MPTAITRPHALVVAYHFPPDAGVGTLRTLRLVRQLVESQYAVTVLTADPRTYRGDTPVDPALLNALPADVRVVRARVNRGLERIKAAVRHNRQVRQVAAGGVSNVPSTAKHRPLLLRMGDVIDAAFAIPDQESGWYFPAVCKGLIACVGRAPDVIYSSAPAWTGQLVAYTLASTLQRPWVADFRDPWARAPWRGDRYAFAMRAARGFERRVVRRADRVLFVSGANHDEFATHYGPALASKFRVVPNGCDAREFSGLTRRAGGSDRFVLLHAGSLYAGRTPVPLFAAIARGIRERLINRSRFRVRFIGSVSLAGTEISHLLKTMDLEDVVEFLPRVPREQSLQAMVDASALLLLQPNHAVAVPAKLYEYLAAGRPILAIAMGETARLVDQSAVGVCAEANEEGAILRAILQVMAPTHGCEVRPDPDLFDGARRAAEMVSVISEVSRRQPLIQSGNEVESDALRLSQRSSMGDVAKRAVSGGAEWT